MIEKDLTDICYKLSELEKGIDNKISSLDRLLYKPSEKQMKVFKSIKFKNLLLDLSSRFIKSNNSLTSPDLHFDKESDEINVDIYLFNVGAKYFFMNVEIKDPDEFLNKNCRIKVSKSNDDIPRFDLIYSI